MWSYPLFNLFNARRLLSKCTFFPGLTHPSILDTCDSLPEHFLQKLDQWNILEPNLSTDPILDLIAFQAFSQSEMACLLNFSYEYIEVAKVGWLLQALYKVLELKLSNCVFDDVQKQRFKRKIKENSSEGAEKSKNLACGALHKKN